MKMLTITNGFTRMSDANLEVRATQISIAMTGNTNFPDPVPTLRCGSCQHERMASELI